MPTPLEYALMAGASYVSTRSETNRIPPPAGWLEPLNSRQVLPSGFEATQYTNGTEIVISYAGTGPGTADWFNGNFPLALGSLSNQLRQAADYYLQVKANAPAGTTISFTGHSLGGGLASLIAVFFGASAHTFDQGPFRNSALTFPGQDSNGNQIAISVAIDLRAYLQGRAAPSLLAPLDAYITANDPWNANPIAADTLAAREASVTNVNVQGEVLSLPHPFSRIGAETFIPQQNNMGFPPVNLHSQALLTAFLQSRGTAPANKALNDVTVPLRDLLGMIFDSALFARSTATTERNFIDHLVRHEAGVDGEFAADAMVTRFTRDQWKLVQEGGLTLLDSNVKKTLMAFAMQKYYEETADSAGYSQELFTDLTGSNGIRFDMADVSARFATAFAQGEKLNLADAKGHDLYFKRYLNSTGSFTAGEQEHIRFVLPFMRDWYVQAGTGGMSAADTQNRGAFMLGGSGADTLTGGTAADLLVGNAGADTLQGGDGNDFLLGGTGNDTYVYTSGFDVILDADGSGSITVGGAALAGGAQYGDNRVHRDGAGNLYVNVGSDRLVIAGKVLIEDHQAGELGINMSGPVADTVDPISPGNFINGDLTPRLKPDGTPETDVWGNIVPDGTPAPGRADTIFDTSGSDLINAGEGNDTVWKERSGDDEINLGGGDDDLFTTFGATGRMIANGGTGRDYLGAGTGRDLIEGGADADGLYGSAENDLIYGNTRGNTQTFISQGATEQGNGSQGEWVDAEDGDDKAFTGAGNDLIAGGGGDDLLVSGGGDDYIAGDWNTISQSSAWRNWTITRQAGTNGDGSTNYTYEIAAINTESNAGTGNDVIYAGGGDDAAYGERGNDVIFGEAGADWLVGGEGNDVILGGTGQDRLNGDGDFGNGNDYLDGGAESDVLRGNDGDDILVGGAGDDTLYGGSGSDIYIFNRGDGRDTVFDTRAGNNIFRFGAGFSASNVTLSLGSLLLDLGDGDAIHIGNFDQSDVFNSSPISGFEFADGTTLTIAELLALGFDLVGTELDDTILGTNATDRISGLGGDDFLEGGEGDDTLTGGTGADLLQGGAGDDTLIGGTGMDTFVGGAGDDLFIADLADADVVLDDAGGANTLRVAYGGDVSALSIFQAGDVDGNIYLVLADAAGGEVAIQGGFAGAVSQFDFGASILTRAELMRQAQVSVLNLTGTAGSQHFIAGSSADVIDGGAGADIMEGNAGDDAYVVDDAGDVVVEYVDEGLDSVQSSVTYTLAANVENLALSGTSAIDATGNASNNALTGNAAANTLDGGEGDDTLAGGFGADTYVFGRSSGLDRIQETDDGSNAVDEVQFAPDVAPADVAVSRTASDLILTITGAGSTLTIAGYFDSSAAVVEEFRFGEGTVWNEATIAQKLSNGTPGNDIISGTAGNDVLNGLAGDDTISGLGGDDRLFGELGLDNLNGNNGADILDGGAGPDNLFGGNGGDTYVFARGYGTDFISETDDGTNPVDKVQFAADILSTDVTVRRNGQNLELTINGTADKVTVGGYFSNDAVGPQVVEQLRFGDGVIWDVATVKALALLPTAGNDTLTGYASDDIISGDAGADVIDGQGGNDTLNGGDGGDGLSGGNGDDILVGGTGADTLSGGAGNDTYRYNSGDGSDTINNGDASAATTDTLLFGPGILPVNTFVTRNGTNFDLFVGPVRIAGYFSSLGGANEIDEIRFTDDPGTVWTVAAIRAMLLAGNEFANFIPGFETDDTIDGLGGNDTLRGAGGNDTLIGGTGDDILFGNSGSDVLTGGAGNDQLNGEESDPPFEVPGADTLDGGAGNDVLRGRRGNDVYVFGVGYGHDTVDETFGSDGTDTLRLNAGVVPANVSLFRHGDDLVVTFAGDQAQAWITQYFTLANKPIEQIVFNDGTVWDSAAIASRLTASSANAFTGTAGNDTFVVDHVGDTITEGANQGTDTVQSSVTYSLPLNVENITLTGMLDVHAFGNGLNNTVTGNTGDNVLTGGDGNDTLNGGAGNDTLNGDGGDDVLNGGADNDRLDGGAGTNTLVGGLGDDTYVLGNGSDTITEAAGGGIDTVIVGGSYTLGDNVENMIVQNRSIFVSFYNGNALDNVITGDPSIINDNYDGDLGADTIIARSGTFTVDNAGDQVITTSIGTDTFIKSKVDWTLGASQFSLELLAFTAAANGTGNAANNMLAGNELANTLSGLDGNDTLFGATAADTLIGGLGNDTYVLADFRIVASNGSITYRLNGAASVNQDTVVEGTGEGIDTVRSLFSYTLSDNVENLELMQQTVGGFFFPQAGTGNTLANHITGNDAANVIDGREGADTMIGGLGDDTYYVDDAGDVVTENAGGGTADIVHSSVSYTLGAQVENLTLTGAAGIAGTGNALDNVLDGAQNTAGNLLTGGLGNDTYVVGAGDTIVEDAGGGTDTVRTDVSFTVGANVENLVLIGSAATTGTGDALDNTLDGSQNAAANTLIGGQGNDTYVVDSGDVIVENAGEGADTVSAAFDYVLSANVENLTLTGSAVAGTGSADANVITGNAFDNDIDGGGGADSMIGGFGNDTYHVDEAGDAITELAGEGVDTVVSSISYALGAELENLSLSGSDVISGTGNELDNILDGSQNEAANVLSGGLGNDVYVLGEGDTIVENAGEGIDTVRSSVTAALGENVENLELVGADAIDGTGNALDNMIVGNDAANMLDGGESGNDILLGGLGDDRYGFGLGRGSDYIADAGGALDTLVFAAGIVTTNVTGARVGDDLVLSFTGSSDTLTLGSFYTSPDNEIERVVFFDGTEWDVDALKGTVAIIGTNAAETLNGTSGDDRMFGLGGNDRLNGNAGNDFLDGGTGTDTLVGGTGDDTYVVDVASDVTTESANAGIDTIQTNITLSLASTSPSRANIENLTLTGSGNINATGNALANRLTGNTGNNTLDGGSGTDTMLGGLGNDTYVVDVAGDVTTENAGEGVDTIQTVITLSLAARDNIENLTLTGSGNVNATGNALDNVLTGNGGTNRLEGGAGNDTLDGGAGTDTMLGGVGDDVYVVSVAADVTTENANEGIDTIRTNITLSIATRNNIENLTLTGSSAINATGNALNNILTGNTGNNTLTGGAGDDTYFIGHGGTDTVVEAANAGEDLVSSSIAVTALAANVEHLILTGTNAINGTGNGLNNLLRGNSGVNTLAGVLGNDILEGGGGNDTLGDTGGKNLLNGQAGNDTLNANTGNELLIGGSGNDAINTSSGADIIGFNRGDGVDTVAVSSVKDNSVSLGGGIRYADLFLQKSGTNLILKTAGTGSTEQVTFTGWYSAAANRSVLNLQVVVEASADFDAGSGDALLNRKVARFNFDGLVNAFDAALVANPGLTDWALTNALLSFHLGGSDTDALGGDLAYRYGLQGNLAAVGTVGAQNVLAATQFGTAAQAFQGLPALESGMTRLS